MSQAAQAQAEAKAPAAPLLLCPASYRPLPMVGADVVRCPACGSLVAVDCPEEGPELRRHAAPRPGVAA